MSWSINVRRNVGMDILSNEMMCVMWLKKELGCVVERMLIGMLMMMVRIVVSMESFIVVGNWLRIFMVIGWFVFSEYLKLLVSKFII